MGQVLLETTLLRMQGALEQFLRRKTYEGRPPQGKHEFRVGQTPWGSAPEHDEMPPLFQKALS